MQELFAQHNLMQSTTGRENASNVIGVDQEAAKDYIFLCNPYVRPCMLDNERRFSGRWAGFMQWSVSLFMVIYQSYQVNKGVFQQVEFEFNRDVYPFFFFNNTVRFDTYLWLVETILAVGGHFLMVFVGILTNLAQAPHWLRRLFALVASLKIWLFVFGEWIFMLAIGGLLARRDVGV